MQCCVYHTINYAFTHAKYKDLKMHSKSKKAKFTPEQAMKTQEGSSVTALLFL
jgi:hypothetical protein